jgi:hypothetical protein
MEQGESIGRNAFYDETNTSIRTHPIGYLDNPELAYIPNLKHWYAYQMVYPFSLALVKASFLALYYRVFPPPNINRYLFWGTSVFIGVYTVAIILVNVSGNSASTSSPLLTTPGFRMSKERVGCLEGFVPKTRTRLQ